MMFFVHQLSYHPLPVGAVGERGRDPHLINLIRSGRSKEIGKNRGELHAGFPVWNFHGCCVYNSGRPVIILVKKNQQKSFSTLTHLSLRNPKDIPIS